MGERWERDVKGMGENKKRMGERWVEGWERDGREMGERWGRDGQ